LNPRRFTGRTGRTRRNSFCNKTRITWLCKWCL